MKRLALSLVSVCAITALSGCCWPGYWGSPFGGCQSGQCSPGGYPGGGYPGIAPTSFQQIQPGGPVAVQPIVTQQAMYPQTYPTYPTMALESLPTHR